ncbi:hypothetical protein DIPPA_27168 [Diplonema papillatum]|nr:hypothetical protein DIPPA_27168 [Diplonema papillatum]KAJ9467933.1 hypothetical protein DIPPA_27168 [Diplonema papillatum]|eukprot:gene6233-9548_t
MPIDYSKWDNIDTDSEPETAEAPPPQAAPAPQPAAGGASGLVPAVLVWCAKDKQGSAPWKAVAIAEDHPVFSAAVPPLAAAVGVPIGVHRVGTVPGGPGTMDNQIATYLHLDLVSGFAPSQWQSGVGTVLVARTDRKPFLPENLEALWMYCTRILDNFGFEGKAPKHLYNPKAFETWSVDYHREAGEEEDEDEEEERKKKKTANKKKKKKKSKNY